MNLPDSIREPLREHMWRIADEIDWLALGAAEKTRHYDNWTKDPEVGGVLQRHVPLGEVRVYIKDSLLKDYPRARRADQDKPFRMLGLDANATVTRHFIKPHGRLLADGRIVCWVAPPIGRAFCWPYSREVTPSATRSHLPHCSRNHRESSRTPARVPSSSRQANAWAFKSSSGMRDEPQAARKARGNAEKAEKGHSTFFEGDRVVLRGLNTTWEAQGRWHAMFGQGRDDREATNADGGARE